MNWKISTSACVQKPPLKATVLLVFCLCCFAHQRAHIKNLRAQLGKKHTPRNAQFPGRRAQTDKKYDCLTTYYALLAPTTRNTIIAWQWHSQMQSYAPTSTARIRKPPRWNGSQSADRPPAAKPSQRRDQPSRFLPRGQMREAAPGATYRAASAARPRRGR